MVQKSLNYQKTLKFSKFMTEYKLGPQIVLTSKNSLFVYSLIDKFLIWKKEETLGGC